MRPQAAPPFGVSGSHLNGSPKLLVGRWRPLLSVEGRGGRERRWGPLVSRPPWVQAVEDP